MSLVETYITRWPSQSEAQKTVPASRPSETELQHTTAEEEIKFTRRYEEG